MSQPSPEYLALTRAHVAEFLSSHSDSELRVWLTDVWNLPERDVHKLMSDLDSYR